MIISGITGMFDGWGIPVMQIAIELPVPEEEAFREEGLHFWIHQGLSASTRPLNCKDASP